MADDGLIANLVQIVTATIGATVCLYALFIAGRDILRNHRLKVNGTNGFTVRIRFRREFVRFVKHSVIIFSGYLILYNVIMNQHIPMAFISFLMMVETLWELWDRYVIGNMSEIDYQQSLRRDRRAEDIR